MSNAYIVTIMYTVNIYPKNIWDISLGRMGEAKWRQGAVWEYLYYYIKGYCVNVTNQESLLKNHYKYVI